MAAVAASTVGAHSASTDEVAFEAVQRFENIHKNYVAIINPNTGRAMLNLKKYGECTLIDPRARIRHYECAADVACILYAPVSLRYFHYMVHCGYISNKTRVVLNDTYNDTYVFVIVENLDSRKATEGKSVEEIIRRVQRQEGQCRVGTDVLQPGDRDRVGYFFHQPSAYFRKSKGKNLQTLSGKVMTGKEWAKRLKVEKAHHDCQLRAWRDADKDPMLTGCQLAALRRAGTAGERARAQGTTPVLHVPILMIQSPKFKIPPPSRT